ncbi:spermine oxidase-like [Musca vetustissima]|uniref:spermine oxidase-like n=1 Tax=Musca vetustissima TaxID=27455 RepID=UPI002AB780B8|nr:spermine oxidase-like [Musca vetustissima]
MCFGALLQKYFRKKKCRSENIAQHLMSNDSIFSIGSSLIATKSSSMPITAPTPPPDPHIIIIGAGAAGLSCATKLLEFGFKNLLILEGENRIGGRIFTQQFANNVIDLGAQWVHGERGNIVYEMVQQHDWLETTGEIYNSFECIRSNGEVLRKDTTDFLKTLLTRILENHSEELNSFEGSFGDFLNERFQEVLRDLSDTKIDKEVAWEFLENFKKIESSETASGMEEVSAKGIHEYWQCPGDYLLNWKDKGYVRFLHQLMGSNEERPFGELEDRIKFNCPVEHIRWHLGNGKVIVRCCNGSQEYEADHVIITVSLGVLKDKLESMFHPPLPMQKKLAIVGLGYGSVGKIFLEFPVQFWPTDWYGFTMLWLKRDLEDLQRTPYEWVEEIFGFYCVNYQPRVLLAWIVGSYVVKLEQMPEDQVIDGCMYLLRRFLWKWEIPQPLKVQISRWQSNSNFLGAYSFRSMLSEQLNVSALQLAQPLTVQMSEIPANKSCSSTSVFSQGPVADDAANEAAAICSKNMKPVLLFAGEATSRHHFSTVHGAVESGYREANRLINFYRKE